MPCVSLCVRVFFDDDKLLSAPMVSARIVPAPTNVPAMGDSVVSRQRRPCAYSLDPPLREQTWGRGSVLLSPQPSWGHLLALMGPSLSPLSCEQCQTRPYWVRPRTGLSKQLVERDLPNHDTAPPVPPWGPPRALRATHNGKMSETCGPFLSSPNG